MLLFLASCGKNSENVPGSQTNSSGTPEKGQSLPTTPTRPPAESSPTVPATSTTETVILRIDTLPQRASDTLTVTIENQTTQVILFPDHLTNCTVIRLEQNVPPPPGDGQWEMIGPCRLATVTQLHSLNPGQRMEVALVPPNRQWIPGIYRAALSYWRASTQSPSITIFTSRFQMDF